MFGESGVVCMPDTSTKEARILKTRPGTESVNAILNMSAQPAAVAGNLSGRSEPPTAYVPPPESNPRTSGGGSREKVVVPTDRAKLGLGKAASSPTLSHRASSAVAVAGTGAGISPQPFHVRVRLVSLSGLTTSVSLLESAFEAQAPSLPSNTLGGNNSGDADSSVVAFAMLEKASGAGRIPVGPIPRSLPIKHSESVESATMTDAGIAVARHKAVWLQPKKKRHQLRKNSLGKEAALPPTPQSQTEKGGNKPNGTSSMLYTTTMLGMDEEADDNPAATGATPLSPSSGTLREVRSDQTEGFISPCLSSSALFSPEIVDVTVGVMKGEERLDLGVSSFVVSGQEVQGQRLDLPVRATVGKSGAMRFGKGNVVVANSSLGDHQDSTVESSPKKKKGGLRGKLFGGSKKSAQKGEHRRSGSDSVVTLDDEAVGAVGSDPRTYGMAPNATLRIHLDICAADILENGEHGISNEEFWERTQLVNDVEDVVEDDDNDASICPITVYDLNTEMGRTKALESNIPNALDTSACESIEVCQDQGGMTVLSSPAAKPFGARPGNFDEVLAADDSDDDDGTKFAISSVKMDPTKDASVASRTARTARTQPTQRTLSPPAALLNRMGIAMCANNTRDVDDRIINQDYSFQTTLPDYDHETFDRGDDDEPDGESDVSRNFKGLNGAAAVNALVDNEEDEDGEDNSDQSRDEDDTMMHSSPPRSDNDDGDSDTFDDTRMRTVSTAPGDDDDGTGTYNSGSVGDDTIDSLNAAKDTLKRFASRVGVKVEDLLERENDRRRGGRNDSARLAEADDGTATYNSSYGSSSQNASTLGSRTYDDGSTLEDDDGRFPWS